MKLISCFRFVGSRDEIELLKIKIKNEENEVEKFILLHNQTRYDGSGYEDTCLGNLNADPFFLDYADRILIVNSAYTVHAEPNNSYEGFAEYKSQINRKLKLKEKMLLGAARRHVCNAFILLQRLEYIEKYMILVSDLDESLDFSNIKKRRILSDLIHESQKKQMPCRILRHKFEYDFDNSWPEHTYRPTNEIDTRWIYCIPWSLVASSQGQILWDIRGQIVDPILDTNLSLAFEYTSCITKSGLKAKLRYIEHANNIDKIQLEYFIKLNKKMTCRYFENTCQFLHFINDQAMNLYKVNRLNESISSNYVIEHMDRLKTNLIPDNYEWNRARLNDALKVNYR